MKYIITGSQHVSRTAELMRHAYGSCESVGYRMGGEPLGNDYWSAAAFCSLERTVNSVFVFRLPHVDQSFSVHGGATPMDYNEANSSRPPQNHKIIVSFNLLDSSPRLISSALILIFM